MSSSPTYIHTYYKLCFNSVFFITFLVYSFFTTTFFLGNHDYRFLRYGFNIFQGLWEGRITQFILPTLLFESQLLPILNSTLGLVSLTFSALILSNLFHIPQKKVITIPFCLLITLTPHVLSQLYYVHTSAQTLFWHFTIILAIYITQKHTSSQKKLKTYISSYILILSSICGYPPAIQLVFTLIFCLITIDITYNNLSIKDIIKKYLTILLISLLVCLNYFIIVKILLSKNIIDGNMYTTHSVPFVTIIQKIFTNLQTPIKVLLSPYPYIGNKPTPFIISLILLSLISFYYTKHLFICSISLIPIFISSLTTSYITPHDVSYLYRINFYSFPYIIAFFYAISINSNLKIIQNISNLSAYILLILFIYSNFTTQKVWYLGSIQDNQKIERLRKDLLPKINTNYNYNLYFIGFLNSNKKFSPSKNYLYKNIKSYKEHYINNHYIDAYLSNLLFITETHNPIEQTSFYSNKKMSLINSYDTPNNTKLNHRPFTISTPTNNKTIYNWLSTSSPTSLITNTYDIFLYISPNKQHKKFLTNYLLTQNKL